MKAVSKWIVFALLVLASLGLLWAVLTKAANVLPFSQCAEPALFFQVCARG
ncbi:MAG: hypothetical protein NC924_03235 [Candidatus Omnitrophica bacterium]|nr:hypothetical protein [Candidatus Omnitrophota bacterium]